MNLAVSFFAHSELFPVYNGYIICTDIELGENTMKESELMRKLHNGDKEAAGLIIERYYADIYRFCLYMVQSKEDAYDITQESFLKFIKYGTSYHHQNLKGYLLMIARNLCFDYFRDKKVTETSVGWKSDNGNRRYHLFAESFKGAFAGYQGSSCSADV